MNTQRDKIIYPSHQHPHGVEDLPEWEMRIWVCTECNHIFTDKEIRADLKTNQWGHVCESHPCHKGQRCESHLEPYNPVLNHLSGRS